MAIVYYINYIPKGIYQASVIEIDNIKIGKGTKENKPFKFYISSNKLEVDGHTFFSKMIKPPIIELYLKKYESKNGTMIIVTKMGTVSMFDKKVKAIIEVNY